jgi:hypothetical protein
MFVCLIAPAKNSVGARRGLYGRLPTSCSVRSALRNCRSHSSKRRMTAAMSVRLLLTTSRLVLAVANRNLSHGLNTDRDAPAILRREPVDRELLICSAISPCSTAVALIPVVVIHRDQPFASLHLIRAQSVFNQWLNFPLCVCRPSSPVPELGPGADIPGGDLIRPTNRRLEECSIESGRPQNNKLLGAANHVVCPRGANRGGDLYSWGAGTIEWEQWCKQRLGRAPARSVGLGARVCGPELWFRGTLSPRLSSKDCDDPVIRRPQPCGSLSRRSNRGVWRLG